MRGKVKYMKAEYKSITISSLESKQGGDPEGLIISGYAARFGNVDSYGDVIEPGAFSNSIAENGSRVKFCFNHNFDNVCGKVLELKEDSLGLYFKAEIIPTTLGKDIAKLIKAGALDEMSFMYRVKESYFTEGANGWKQIRHLKEVDVSEISVVGKAANDQAKIENIGIKSALDRDFLAALPDNDLCELKRFVDAEMTKRWITKIN